MTNVPYREGKLCLVTLDAGCQPSVSTAANATDTPDRSVMVRFADLLALSATARTRGYHRLADEYAERLIDEVWGPVL